MSTSSGEASENLTAYRFRWIGYGFLVFALVDAIHILLTIQSGQPTWLLQTIGQFVERAVVPLLGFTLIFFGEYYGRRNGEKLGLRLLSWLCLVLAVVFLLMIPPIFLQTLSVNSQAQQVVDKQVEQQLTQLNQLEAQLARSKPEELKALATQLSGLGVSVDPSKPEAVKAQVQARIKTVREQLQSQAQGATAGQASGLWKNAIKWSLGALITAVLLFYLWRSSRWAR
ncbi:MAG: HpsJ family protein [Leptolyngbyaceae cyanobacterium bins.302]|nr:HpsJ family protein [Leptolyngbyaceae cyanobacterium bins.302]